jgi:hypothetical protein
VRLRRIGIDNELVDMRESDSKSQYEFTHTCAALSTSCRGSTGKNEMGVEVIRAGVGQGYYTGIWINSWRRLHFKRVYVIQIISTTYGRIFREFVRRQLFV